jgi:MFS superfamily sulfate permease-like transporter
MELSQLKPGQEPEQNLFFLLKTELLSGLTVALALVPEAVAFAFVAGVKTPLLVFMPHL